MNKYKKILLTPLLAVLVLTGCSLTRESAKYRDEYFAPVNVLPQRVRPNTQNIDLDNLKNQLDAAAKSALMLRDSLQQLQRYSSSLLTSTRTLVEKVNELETKSFLTLSKQKNLEQSVAQLQIENKQLAQQLTELRSQLLTSMQSPEKSNFVPAKSFDFKEEYTDALALFIQEKYYQSRMAFKKLIDKGIDEDLLDNCEYWIGENYYAQKNYFEAIKSFQKTLTIANTNKNQDAYYMLGKSYEKTGDLNKAKWAYEELMLLYPENIHAKFVKNRLDVIKRKLPATIPQKVKTNKSSL